MIQRSFPVRSVLVGLALAFLAAVPGSSQPAFQVADIVTGSPMPPRSPFGVDFAELSGTVFFSVDDGIHGAELWKSDGTEAGTVLVKDICPGICSSWPDDLVTKGGHVYVSTSESGVWRSDGTAAGTVQIADLQAVEMEELNGQLLLMGYTRATDYALWSSDGTAAGTVLLRQMGYTPFFQGKAGGLLYISNDNFPEPEGRELWKTDGTAAGTALVKDIYPGSQNSLSQSSHRFPAIGGRLFFRALTASGYDLWVTDGTAAGTYRVKDLEYPYSFAVLGTELLFLEGLGPTRLWKTDGTEVGTILLAQQDPSAPGAFSELTTAGAQVFFQGTDPVAGVELWTSDGTPAGTVRVTDIASGAPSSLGSYSNFFTALGDLLLFFAKDGTTGEEPWVSDGSAAGTIPLGDLNPRAAGSLQPGELGRPDRGGVAAGRWFFGAYTAPEGWALWTTDGTPVGTQLVRRFPTLGSSLGFWSPLADHEGTLFFGVRENSLDTLWKSDGSAAGTTPVKLLGASTAGAEIVSWNGLLYYNFAGVYFWQSDGTEAGTQILNPTPGFSFRFPGFLTPASSGLFYGAFTGSGSSDIWVTDGSPAGTQRLHTDDVPLTPPTAFRDGVAFGGSNLWLSDGTPAGTVPVDTTVPLAGSQLIGVAGDTLFFWGQVPGVTGYEPWASNGTAAGTRLLRDIRPGFDSSLSRSFPPTASFRNLWFFLADDGLFGEELWVSDGTTPGTRRVRDIRPGPQSAAIRTLVTGRDRIWFTADDGAHGEELWMSDGTEAGTRMVRDIVPGAGTSSPRELAAIGHVLLFSAFDLIYGIELWRTDGTEAGTVRLQDIAPGLLPSSPSEITASGPYVYFAANDGTTGFEPWAFDRTVLGGYLTATKTVSGQPVPGGILTFTITISNVGAGPHPDRPGDELVDVLPAGLSLVSTTADVGSATTDLPANRVAWNGALPIGGTTTVTIEATVTASRGTVLRNQATLSFDANGDGVHESAAVSGVTDILITSGALDFYTVQPCRVFDTRNGTPLVSGAVRTFVVAGSCGIPADAEAVAANLTVVNPTAPGHLTIWAAGAPAPGTSNINVMTGMNRANNATLALNGAGAIDVRAALFGASPQAHLILDVNGYYRPDPADDEGGEPWQSLTFLPDS